MTQTATDTAQCAHPHCWEPLPIRSTGRPARFCSDTCRKSDHRMATAAREARQRLPRLRRYMDESLAEVEKAVRRLHATGLSEDELLMRPEPYEDADYAVRSHLDRLRAAVREHRDSLATAASHPAGAPTDQDED